MATAISTVRKFFPEVERVKDGTRHIVIHVLPKHSKASTKKNHSRCALAMACKEQENADGVIVSVSTVYVVKDKVAFRYQNLGSTSREIVSFDRDAGFEPGDYMLKPPERKLNEPAKGKRHKGDPKAGNKAFRHITTNIRTNLSQSEGD